AFFKFIFSIFSGQDQRPDKPPSFASTSQQAGVRDVESRLLTRWFRVENLTHKTGSTLARQHRVPPKRNTLSRLSFPPLFSLDDRFSKSLVSERMDHVASTRFWPWSDDDGDGRYFQYRRRLCHGICPARVGGRRDDTANGNDGGTVASRYWPPCAATHNVRQLSSSRALSSRK